MKTSTLGLLLVLISFATMAQCGMTVIDFMIPFQSYVYQRVGVYNKGAVAFGNQVDPYGTWEIEYVDVKGRTNHSTEFMILTADEYHHLGIRTDRGSRLFCCSPELYEYGACDTPHYTAFAPDRIPDGRDTLHYVNVTWTLHEDGTARAVLPISTIQLKGNLWYLVSINCGQTHYRMLGTSYWRNPYGHVLGQNFPMIYVNGIMMCVYLLFLVLWCIQSYRYRKDIMGLQVSVGIVIAVAFVQNTISFASIMKYNGDGLNNTVFNVFDALLYTLKLTLSRLLLLLVSMGYTITKKKLTMQRVIILGVTLTAYFIAVAAEVFIEVSHKDGRYISNTSRGIVSFFIVLTNGFILLWSVFELIKTIQKLRNQNEDVKMRMFRKLAVILVFAFLISAILYIVHFGITVSGNLDNIWKGEFLFSAYWEFAFFVIILGIAIIWRPTLDNKRFAFSIQLSDDPNNTAEMSQVQTGLDEATTEVTPPPKKTKGTQSEREEEEEQEDSDEE